MRIGVYLKVAKIFAEIISGDKLASLWEGSVPQLANQGCLMVEPRINMGLKSSIWRYLIVQRTM